MAKKDFNKLINAESKPKTTTQAFFSNETLNKAENQEEPKTRRNYTTFKSKQNKNHFIGLRLNEKQYTKLLNGVESSESGTITNYLIRLLEKGL